MLTGNKENLSNFDKLTAALRSVYGQEKMRNIENERSGLSGKAEWVTDSGKVWVSIIPVTGNTSMLSTGFVPAGSAP